MICGKRIVERHLDIPVMGNLGSKEYLRNELCEGSQVILLLYAEQTLEELKTNWPVRHKKRNYELALIT